ncbi:hypothetical protein BKA70DRAFT_875343 [Coprinopsis sp. MPI-PUGE-AT-0042]|nr:hypothetical protein BKA70DRAFT_875343 [Coprinopsis sp. MPI-PUGE-AT-0042]
MFLESTFAGWANKFTPEQAGNVRATFDKLKRRAEGIPILDIRGKQKQVDALFELLTRETKLAIFGDKNTRDEVLSEIIVTLTDWLNDIWSTVYEHRLQYRRAHTCLLFVAESLKHLDEGAGARCRCDFINLPVEVYIRNQDGKVVKRLRTRGAQRIDTILFWIWRDLFVCILDGGSEYHKKQIPEMLDEIEQIYGFPSMERILYGGKRDPDDDEGDEDEQYVEEEDVFDEDDDYESDDEFYGSIFESSHWEGEFFAETEELRDLVEQNLIKIFSISPTFSLFRTIESIANEPSDTRLRLDGILMETAGSTSETLVEAIKIANSNSDCKRILQLLDDYSHLLRPRDSNTLQQAAAVLSHDGFALRAVAILEGELHDTLEAIFRGLQASFARFSDAAHKKTLAEILRLRVGQPRQERIEQYVDSIMTSSTSFAHNMAFAAMMMGLPFMPGVPTDGEDNSDLLTLLDIEQGGNDPDLDDLRDEFRPNLTSRLEGWTSLAPLIKGGTVSLAKVYSKALELMPFLKANDIVAEMVTRLDNRPSKLHLMDALQALGAFCKSQRKKLATVRKQKEKQKGGTSAAASGSKGKQKAPADELDDLPPLIPIDDPAPGSSSTPAPPPPTTSSANPPSTAGPSSGPSSKPAPPASTTRGKEKSQATPDSDSELDAETVRDMFEALTSPESRARIAQAMAQFVDPMNDIDEDEEEEEADNTAEDPSLVALLARMRAAGAGAASNDIAAASMHLANASSSTSATSPGAVGSPGAPSPGTGYPFYFGNIGAPSNGPAPFTGLDEVD